MMICVSVMVAMEVVSTVVRGGGKDVVNNVYGVGSEIVIDCFVGEW